MTSIRFMLVFIIIGIVVAMGVGYFSLKSLQNEPISLTGEPVFAPHGPAFTPPPQPPASSTPTFVVTGADGSSIEVKDFRAAATTTPGTQIMVIREAESGQGTYSITFYPKDTSFSVVLLSEPLSEARATAERDLAELLGIGESALCRLRYSVYVPIRINEFYAATNLGFSFCPRAVELP